MSEIWAILQHDAGTLHENTGELVAELTDIAKRQQDQAAVCAVMLTSPDAMQLDTTLLTTLGVQRLYLLEHPQLSHYTTEGYVNALAWLVRQYSPTLVVISATADGRDCTPRLGARLHLPFAANCLGLDLYDDALFALRTVYEGRAYIQTRTELHGYPALATLLPGVRGAPTRLRNSASTLFSLEITRLTPEIAEKSEWQGIRRLAIEAASPEEIGLEAAERIVAGGRGVGREGFTNVATFARLLGASVGATRVATDQGWIEHARQIGATGKSVHPKLYIACGISGAAQHTSGVREAQTVVAINPDRSAPIFALADLGLLGDANQILPLASEMLEKENIKETSQ
jgi:electron transfer flavoprotein alpha subunit